MSDDEGCGCDRICENLHGPELPEAEVSVMWSGLIRLVIGCSGVEILVSKSDHPEVQAYSEEHVRKHILVTRGSLTNLLVPLGGKVKVKLPRA
jgi:hypothetical protein